MKTLYLAAAIIFGAASVASAASYQPQPANDCGYQTPEDEADEIIGVEQPCPDSPTPASTSATGPTCVTYGGEKLVPWYKTWQSSTVIPAGEYVVTWMSADGYPGRENISQPNERWRFNVAGTVSPWTDDLADLVREATRSGQFSFTAPTAGPVLFEHWSIAGDESSPNSLSPSGLCFTPVPQPTTIPTTTATIPTTVATTEPTTTATPTSAPQTSASSSSTTTPLPTTQAPETTQPATTAALPTTSPVTVPLPNPVTTLIVHTPPTLPEPVTTTPAKTPATPTPSVSLAPTQTVTKPAGTAATPSTAPEVITVPATTPEPQPTTDLALTGGETGRLSVAALLALTSGTFLIGFTRKLEGDDEVEA
jgi:hypothetical protein